VLGTFLTRVGNNLTSRYRLVGFWDPDFTDSEEAGMLIIEAVMRFKAGTPKLRFALDTEPAMVENP
jgi:hypothetical protein